jgi:hypothetical protein
MKLVYREKHYPEYELSCKAFTLTDKTIKGDIVVTKKNKDKLVGNDNGEWWYWEGIKLYRAKYGFPTRDYGLNVKEALDAI